MYNLLVNPEVNNFQNLNPETHLTTVDQSVINKIWEDVTPHQEMIIEHDYTGNINQKNVDDIVQPLS